MYCLGCNYDLTGLAAGPCPECGRGFDPDDDATFASHPHRERNARRLEISIIVLATSPLVSQILVHLALVAARVSLGRWPHRWGRDDPMEIPGIGWLCYLAYLSMPAMPASLLFSLFFLFLLARLHAWPRVVRAFLISAALWIAGFSIVRGDPAQAWLWIMD